MSFSKYRAIRVGEDGLPYDKSRHKEKFDSKKEYRRWCELKMLQDYGQISRLELQPCFELISGEDVVAHYKADFMYHEKDGRLIVEDVKGMKTAMYRLKKKMMKACHGIEIRET